MFAALYDRMAEPAERGFLGERRARLLGGLRGVVLDIGSGTGVNLQYLSAASRVVAVEPDPAMRRRLAHRAGARVQVCAAVAEALPLADASVDAVVCTLVLCTVSDPDRTLGEVRRVLRPGGRLVVLEHVRGGGRFGRWQDLVTPVWRWFGAGCHPNRDTRAAIERAGLAFEHVEAFAVLPRVVPVRPMLEAVVTHPAR